MEEPLRAEGDARAAVFALQHGHSIDELHMQPSDSMTAGVNALAQPQIAPVVSESKSSEPGQHLTPNTERRQNESTEMARQCEWCGSLSSKYKNYESFQSHRRHCRRMREPNYVPVKYEQSSPRYSETGEMFCEWCDMSATMYKNAHSFQVHRRYCRKKKRKAEEARREGGPGRHSGRPRTAPAPEQRAQRPSDPVVERFVSAPLTPSQLAAAQLAPQPPAIAQEVFSPFPLDTVPSSSSALPLPVAAGSQPGAPALPPASPLAPPRPQLPEQPAPAEPPPQHRAPLPEPFSVVPRSSDPPAPLPRQSSFPIPTPAASPPQPAPFGTTLSPHVLPPPRPPAIGSEEGAGGAGGSSSGSAGGTPNLTCESCRKRCKNLQARAPSLFSSYPRPPARRP
eukprot:tig00000317_g24018.t1